MRVNNNKNILLFTTTLMNGGAEVFLSNLKPVLELLGFNVYVMVNNSFDQSTYSSEYYSLHEKNFNFLKPLRLKKFLKEHEIDLIIDNRARLNLFKTTVYECVFGSTKKIKIIHSYHIHSYLFKNKTINKLLFTHYSKIVCVSKAIENLVKKNTGLLNTIHIPNFTPITESDETININFPYILFYGRFDNVSKDLLFLLDSYKNSSLPSSGIRLILMGDGKDKLTIKEYIKKSNIADSVAIYPFKSPPFSIVSHALFTVLTSNYEGFPMAIIESLSLSVPVVSSNFTGVDELLQHKVNGLIVDKDVKEYSKALNDMAFDKELYYSCKNNCKTSISHLSLNTITKRWSELIHAII